MSAMILYQGYCNDCGWYGKGEQQPDVARWDALEHGHNDVEVQRQGDGPVFVMWRSTDGRGEDGEIYIH
jgi:hypothetical protein